MERSFGLAGSIIKTRYRANSIASVSREIVVYAAEELRYGRPIALKVLRDDVAADAEFAAAVREQASALAISAHVHRGLPRIYECGTTDAGELFIALEPTRGITLREVLDVRGALEPSTALRIASQVGEALETLHHSGILHGHLGPESVLLVKDSDGTEHVTLVGVELTAAYRTPLGRRRRDASPPAYLAPEQVEGGETSEATDQYALGMLLRELLTAGTPREAIDAPEIERIITTALEARPERRFPDLSVMVNDLWAAQTGLAQPVARPRPVETRSSSHRRRRPRNPRVALRIAAAVGTAGIIAAVVWLALSGELVSRARDLVTAAPVTALPVVQEATVDPSPLPPAPPVAREETAPRREAPVVKNTTADALAHPAAAPRPAPVVPRQERSAAPVADGGPPRPVAEDRDGSAIIDWLLKPRR